MEAYFEQIAHKGRQLGAHQNEELVAQLLKLLAYQTMIGRRHQCARQSKQLVGFALRSKPVTEALVEQRRVDASRRQR